MLVSYSQNSHERALVSGLSKIVRFAESDFSGVAIGRIGYACSTLTRTSFGIHRNPIRSRLDFRGEGGVTTQCFDFE